MTRHTGITRYARGLLYLTNYHIHDYEVFNKMFNGWKHAPREGIYRSKEQCTWTRSTDETNLSKDTVKRQDSIMEDSKGTILEDEHIQKNMPTLYNPWTGNIYTQPPPYNYTWQTADYQRIRQEQCVRVLLESKNPDKCSEVATWEDFSFLEQIRLKTLQLFVPNSKRLGG